MRTRVLYISYDGILEPLGESQVLRYLEGLASHHTICLLSFEKFWDWQDVVRREALRRAIEAAGIKWIPLRYHKRPSGLATAYDVAQGIGVGAWAALRYRVRIVHARSYVASVIALALKRLFGLKYIFDMRGFWADERLDGGLWCRDSSLYRLAKHFERKFLLGADQVISLTHAGVRELRRFPYLTGRVPPVTVIPTCADLKRFAPQAVRDRRGGFVLGYVGSAGTWYLFQETADCFAQLLRIRADARLLIVNRGEHAFIRECLARSGVPESAVELTHSTHDGVPMQMARMDAGVFFIKPTFSKQASAPTKLAEFLGCGIPCLANAGVGDMADVLEGCRVGVALGALGPAEYESGLRRLLEMVADSDTRDRCVAAAHRFFSLEEGVAQYATIYRALGSQG